MLDNKYNFLEKEKKWQEYWQSEGIYKFDAKSDKPVYSIDTPPPTASGHIHLGHIFSYSQAEFIARFKRMTGYNVYYPFGYDNNGLPTERLVEKECDVKAHNLPREEFNKLCLKTVKKYEEFYKDTFIRSGISADFSLSYSTIGEDVQKVSQASFMDLYKKGKVYHAHKDALWCCECQTSIAQAEIESKEAKITFNYMKWDIGGEKIQIEIATTRPEMLAACVCVFVNPKDKRYKSLVGKKAIVPLYNFEVPILTDELADENKGSGAVMCCTFGDQTDALWYFKHKLERKMVINDYGRMTELAGKYAGMKIKTAREEIIKDLKEAGVIYKQEELIHQAPVHERCGTPIEITLKKQWFVKILEHKEELLKQGDKIDWYPKFRKQAYTDWVKNLDRDWCVSRQRYYGVPIPVWYCKNCGNAVLAEEKALPVNPLKTMPEKTCKCGKLEYIPESDVFDTWFTSSLTPQINTKNGIKLPMNLRPNAREIIRTWDFYTIVKELYHSNSIPWNDVMISGWAMANKDEKISKSKENSKFNLDYAFLNYSADVVRYWATTGGLGRDIMVNDEGFSAGGRLITKLWNASRFALSFLQGYTPKKVKLYPIDEWIMGRLKNTVCEFKKYMEEFEVGYARETIEKFFWKFCDDYIELVKNRLYKPEIYGEEAKLSGQYTCYWVLFSLLKLFAPFIPHITEEVYQDYFVKQEKVKSIHLLQLSEQEEVSEDMLKAGDEICEIISKCRQFKSENNLSQKEQLNEVELTGYDKFDELAAADLKAVCGILNLKFTAGSEKSVIIKR